MSHEQQQYKFQSSYSWSGPAHEVDPLSCKWTHTQVDLLRLFEWTDYHVSGPIRATTISDLATADLRHLRKEALDLSIHCRSSLKWPRRTGCIPTAWAKLWKKALLSTIVRDQSLRLKHDLGTWKGGERQHWEWFWNFQTERLYNKEGDSWRVWIRHSAGRRQNAAKYQISEELIEVLPQDTVEAACAKMNHNTVRFLGLIEFERENLPLRSIETTLKNSIGKDHWLIGTHFCENWDIIAL